MKPATRHGTQCKSSLQSPSESPQQDWRPAFEIYRIGYACGSIQTSTHRLPPVSQPAQPASRPYRVVKTAGDRGDVPKHPPLGVPGRRRVMIAPMMRELSQSVVNLIGFMVLKTPAALAAERCLVHIVEFESAPEHATEDALRHAGEAVRTAECDTILRSFGSARRWILAGQLIAKAEISELTDTPEKWDATIRKMLTDSGARGLGDREATPLAGWDKVVREWFKQRQQANQNKVPRIGPEFNWIEIGGRRLEFSRNRKLRPFLLFLHKHLHDAGAREFELGKVIGEFKTHAGQDLRTERLKEDTFKNRTSDFNLLFREIGRAKSASRNRHGNVAHRYLWLVPLDTPVG